MDITSFNLLICTKVIKCSAFINVSFITQYGNDIHVQHPVIPKVHSVSEVLFTEVKLASGGYLPSHRVTM